MTKRPVDLGLTKSAEAGHELPLAKNLARAFGFDAQALIELKLSEIGQLFLRREFARDAEVHARVVRAVELYESLEPAHGAEGLLAMQMVGTHARNTGPMRESPRCGAKTRKGTPCQALAVQGKRRRPNTWWRERFRCTCRKPECPQAWALRARVPGVPEICSRLAAGRKEDHR